MGENTSRLDMRIMIFALMAMGIVYWLIARPSGAPRGDDSQKSSETEILRRLTAPEGSPLIDQNVLEKLTAPQ